MSESTSLQHPHDQLIELISRWIAPLGYRVIHLELQSHRQKVLRIYIDFLEASADKTIGIEDCVKVTKALDEPLENSPEVGNLLPSTYELEVSSTGINRALRSEKDFEQFTEQRIRIHTFRSLSCEELNNEPYFAVNPKQKNFIGVLKGIRQGQVLLSISSSSEKGKKTLANKKVKPHKKALHETHPSQETHEIQKIDGEEDIIIHLPFPLISKANLEPEISVEGARNDRE